MVADPGVPGPGPGAAVVAAKEAAPAGELGLLLRGGVGVAQERGRVADVEGAGGKGAALGEVARGEGAEAAAEHDPEEGQVHERKGRRVRARGEGYWRDCCCFWCWCWWWYGDGDGAARRGAGQRDGGGAGQAREDGGRHRYS